eukprot:1525220-Prymnesium_polylepis.1
MACKTTAQFAASAHASSWYNALYSAAGAVGYPQYSPPCETIAERTQTPGAQRSGTISVRKQCSSDDRDSPHPLQTVPTRSRTAAAPSGRRGIPTRRRTSSRCILRRRWCRGGCASGSTPCRPSPPALSPRSVSPPGSKTRFRCAVVRRFCTRGLLHVPPIERCSKPPCVWTDVLVSDFATPGLPSNWTTVWTGDDTTPCGSVLTISLDNETAGWASWQAVQDVRITTRTRGWGWELVDAVEIEGP